MARADRAGDTAGAREAFDGFALKLEAHMTAEQDGVFAALEKMEEFADNVARVRAEHDEFRRAVTRQIRRLSTTRPGLGLRKRRGAAGGRDGIGLRWRP